MLFQALSKPRLFALVALCAAATVGAESAGLPLFSSISPEHIQQGLEECFFVKRLNEIKAASSPSSSTSLAGQILALLFPSSSPAINALLATAYISGPPNFLLALCPPNIDPSSLSVMVAFAVGGLLGDTLFHLLPEIFLGEQEPDRVKLVLLEPNRNLLLGVGILSGIVAFMAMDKTLRIATGGAGHSHEHGGVIVPEKDDHGGVIVPEKDDHGDGHANGSPSEKASTTDALSSSFYASPALGATTTMAVFFHEIPHEVGDFALLIQSGFSKRKAMGAQFVTAIGAFLGTLIGIFVQEIGGSGSSSNRRAEAGNPAPGGIWGTSLQWADMLLPFTAGTFLYVGTVAVIPELLETSGLDRSAEIKKTGAQFAAMFVGAAIMLGISWS
ncbi:hypothetical protein DV737_g4928, partial [Chaetothyriales sp. CBS 132003]